MDWTQEINPIRRYKTHTYANPISVNPHQYVPESRLPSTPAGRWMKQIDIRNKLYETYPVDEYSLGADDLRRLMDWCASLGGLGRAICLGAFWEPEQKHVTALVFSVDCSVAECIFWIRC